MKIMGRVHQELRKRSLTRKSGLPDPVRYLFVGLGCMTPRLGAGWFVVILVVLLANTALADEVIMKNGDRLHGTVVSMAQGKLVFKTSYAGEISIDWGEVVRLSTEGPLEVSLGGEKVLKGKAVSAEEGTLLVQPEEGPEIHSVPMAEVKGLAPPKPPDRWKFSARVSAGASKSSGNTDTEKYHLDSQLGLSKHPHRMTLYAQADLEKSRGKDTKDQSLASLSYDRFLNEKWYLFGNGQIERDKFSDLDLLTTLAAGAGYQVWKSKQKNLSFQIGPSYVIERYSKRMQNFDNRDHREYAAAFWAVDFDMWFFNRFIQLFHHNDGTLGLEDTDMWRIRTRTGVRVPIVFKFFASLQYNYDFVNSPADGKKKYDQEYLFKLGWEF